jgi:hypothetical protein
MIEHEIEWVVPKFQNYELEYKNVLSAHKIITKKCFDKEKDFFKTNHERGKVVRLKNISKSEILNAGFDSFLLLKNKKEVPREEWMKKLNDLPIVMQLKWNKYIFISGKEISFSCQLNNIDILVWIVASPKTQGEIPII